jgi:hypothetical protein
MMLLSDSVGGADDSRNGFVNFSPVKVTEISGFMSRIIGKNKTGARNGGRRIRRTRYAWSGSG